MDSDYLIGPIESDKTELTAIYEKCCFSGASESKAVVYRTIKDIKGENERIFYRAIGFRYLELVIQAAPNAIADLMKL